MTPKKQYIFFCHHCKKELPHWGKGVVSGRIFSKTQDMYKRTSFCSCACYENYKKQFLIDTYKGYPIYCIKVKNKNCYFYDFDGVTFEYCFYWTNIDGCKRAIDIRIQLKEQSYNSYTKWRNKYDR